MRKTQMALAAVALVASSAALADIKFYGTIDAGYYSINSTDAKGGTGGAQAGFSGAGQTSPNLWGIKGSEDLGGGLTASFNLEGQFSTSTGQSDNSDNGQGQATAPATGSDVALAPNGQMFGRAANVGLSGDFGKLTLGQQIDPAFLALALTDPRGAKMAFSGLFAWFPNAGVIGGLKQGIFDSGMISYTSPEVNGLSAQVGMSRPATYNAQSVNTSSKSNTLTSAHVKYIANDITLAFGYLDAKDEDGAKAVKVNHFGAGYQIGSLVPKAYYTNYKTGAGASITQYAIGAKYDLGDGISLDGGYYNTKNDAAADNKSNMFVIGAEKAFSKQTALYAHWAQMRTGADADATTGLMIAGNGSGSGPGGGATGTGWGLGVRHSW